jgi:hypothetical protein
MEAVRPIDTDDDQTVEGNSADVARNMPLPPTSTFSNKIKDTTDTRLDDALAFLESLETEDEASTTVTETVVNNDNLQDYEASFSSETEIKVDQPEDSISTKNITNVAINTASTISADSIVETQNLTNQNSITPNALSVLYSYNQPRRQSVGGAAVSNAYPQLEEVRSRTYSNPVPEASAITTATFQEREIQNQNTDEAIIEVPTDAVQVPAPAAIPMHNLTTAASSSWGSPSSEMVEEQRLLLQQAAAAREQQQKQLHEQQERQRLAERQMTRVQAETRERHRLESMLNEEQQRQQRIQQQIHQAEVATSTPVEGEIISASEVAALQNRRNEAGAGSSSSTHRGRYLSCGACRVWLRGPVEKHLILCPNCRSINNCKEGESVNQSQSQSQQQIQRTGNGGVQEFTNLSFESLVGCFENVVVNPVDAAIARFSDLWSSSRETRGNNSSNGSQDVPLMQMEGRVTSNSNSSRSSNWQAQAHNAYSDQEMMPTAPHPQNSYSVSTGTGTGGPGQQFDWSQAASRFNLFGRPTTDTNTRTNPSMDGYIAVDNENDNQSESTHGMRPEQGYSMTQL